MYPRPHFEASDGSIITNSKAKVDLLNQYFHSVFSPGHLLTARHSPTTCSVLIKLFWYMLPIETKTAGTDKLISELDEHKACRPDGIRSMILKRLRPPITPTLVQCIFSKSLVGHDIVQLSTSCLNLCCVLYARTPTFIKRLATQN